MTARRGRDGRRRVRPKALEARSYWAKKKRPRGWIWILVLFVLLALGGWLITSYAGGNSEPASDSQTDFTQRATDACMESIRGELKAPSTATFPPPTTVLGTGPTADYTVLGAVDAQNSFGAQVRTNYGCTMKLVEGLPGEVTSLLDGPR